MLDSNIYNKGPNSGDFSRVGTLVIYKTPLDVEPDARRAKCTLCSNTSLVSSDIPFFKSMPKESLDEFYCGCRGFD